MSSERDSSDAVPTCGWCGETNPDRIAVSTSVTGYWCIARHDGPRERRSNEAPAGPHPRLLAMRYARTWLAPNQFSDLTTVEKYDACAETLADMLERFFIARQRVDKAVHVGRDKQVDALYDLLEKYECQGRAA